MEVKRKEGEAASSLVYRFNKRVQQSGLMKEVKKRRFNKRAVSKIKKRISAIYKDVKMKEVQKLRKLGKV